MSTLFGASGIIRATRIFCHDDIELREDPVQFVDKLNRILSLPETGFVGPAGTTYLSQNAVWWDQEQWRAGRHRGKVWHLQGAQ